MGGPPELSTSPLSTKMATSRAGVTQLAECQLSNVTRWAASSSPGPQGPPFRRRHAHSMSTHSTPVGPLAPQHPLGPAVGQRPVPWIPRRRGPSPSSRRVVRRHLPAIRAGRALAGAENRAARPKTPFVGCGGARRDDSPGSAFCAPGEPATGYGSPARDDGRGGRRPAQGIVKPNVAFAVVRSAVQASVYFPLAGAETV
jgi:hypothetical protein